jgi:CheY-like chemotaxis protein
MKAEKNVPEDTKEILIVEDSPTQAEVLKYLLEQHGYPVLAANNGKQALAFLDKHKPALVISDIVMPEMDGYELCRRIKSANSKQDIPVILLTSLSSAEDVLDGLECGADNFITKPYGEEYLLLHVEQIIASRKLFKNERVRVGLEIMFGGKRRFVTADQQQMLTLLISTYEEAVRKNAELVKTQNMYKLLNERLEDIVEERTAALSAEIEVRTQAEEKIKGQLDELQRWHDALNGREGRVLEVKKEVNELLARLGEPLRYSSVEEESGK